MARAYKELEAEGLVTTRSRAGTVVAAGPSPLDVALNRSAAEYAIRAARAGLSESAAIDLVRAALRAPRKSTRYLSVRGTPAGPRPCGPLGRRFGYPGSLPVCFRESSTDPRLALTAGGR